MDYPKEMFEKMMTAKSADEILAIAKEYHIEMTQERAQTYFEQISSKELDDDLLDLVAGGCSYALNGDAEAGEGKKRWLILRDL